MGVKPSIRGRGEVDRVIARLADAQHGVVSRSQLLGRGVGRNAIGRRLESMRLRPIHRGVYAVGHRKLSQAGWCRAAILAYGLDAVLSHRSAATRWGILEGWRTTVDIALPRDVKSRIGIRTHTAAVAPDERTVLDGIPVTTPARTLLDLAAVLQPHELNRALEGPRRCG